MHAFLGIISALFTAGYAKHLGCSNTRSSADPTITPAPRVNLELLRRQNGNRFMGWLSLSGNSYESVQCDEGLTLYQTADRWRCCATTAPSCNIPLGCVSGSLIYSFAATGTEVSGTVGTYDCTRVYTDPMFKSFTICNTGFLFENTLDTDPRTNLFCGPDPVNWSYYRVKPDTPASSTPDNTPLSTPAETTPTVTSTTGSSTSSPPPTDLPAPQKKKSQAWIAGAAVGGAVLVALIGGLLWFFLIRKKRDKTTVPPPSTMSQSYPASPNQQATLPYNNYPPPMQQNQQSMVPYGVAGPGSPHSYGSTTPFQPGQQQLHTPAGYPHAGSPPGSPGLDQNVYKVAHEGNRPFSTDLSHNVYPQPHPFSNELDDTSRYPR